LSLLPCSLLASSSVWEHGAGAPAGQGGPGLRAASVGLGLGLWALGRARAGTRWRAGAGRRQSVLVFMLKKRGDGTAGRGGRGDAARRKPLVVCAV
jgi:hypothetical protein